MNSNLFSPLSQKKKQDNLCICAFTNCYKQMTKRNSLQFVKLYLHIIQFAFPYCHVNMHSCNVYYFSTVCCTRTDMQWIPKGKISCMQLDKENTFWETILSKWTVLDSSLVFVLRMKEYIFSALLCNNDSRQRWRQKQPTTRFLRKYFYILNAKMIQKAYFFNST